MKTSVRTFGAALLLALAGGIAVFAPQAASAAQPTVEHATNQWTGITLGAGTLCDFPVVWDVTQERTTTTFYASDGTTVSMKIWQGTEQDTFFANGKVLVGDPYHFMLREMYESGELVARYSSGVTERVPLPDGGVFISAGHVNVVTGPVFSVDSGNDRNNPTAFCAALS